MRALGLDIGSKTVGVAISDPLGFTAQPVETIRFQMPSESYKRLLHHILENHITDIVVGLPLNMNGTEGPSAKSVRGFIDSFEEYLARKKIIADFKFVDERLSTVAAERPLLSADLSRAKRKKVIDKMAAVFILQGYLDSLSFHDLSN